MGNPYGAYMCAHIRPIWVSVGHVSWENLIEKILLYTDRRVDDRNGTLIRAHYLFNTANNEEGGYYNS